jgi:cytidine deaminase
MYQPKMDIFLVDQGKLYNFLITNSTSMKEKTLQINFTEYDTVDQLTEKHKDLIIQARKAAVNAYAPYSGFRVGAAVQLGNGIIITGNNQENAAYPSGLCAERTALFYASAQYPKVPVTAIAISTINRRATPSEIAKPCGACRQVMAEYEDLAGTPMQIILDSADRILILNGIDNLLPLRFKKEDVK